MLRIKVYAAAEARERPDDSDIVDVYDADGNILATVTNEEEG